MKESDDRFQAIRDFYDNEYYAKHTAHPKLPWHCRKIAARLGDMAGKRVLDVACGTGEWLDYFHKGGAEISGIDLSRRAIDSCLTRFPGGDFHCGPAEALPFDDLSFDLVTCMGSLEHFLDKPQALMEMRRVANTNARFVILVPNAGFLTRRLRLYSGTQQVKAKEDVLELNQWRQLFNGAGLRVIEQWRDLHTLSWPWIRHGNPLAWPIRAVQALALTVWPIAWQYQIYHYCQTAND